MVGYSFGNFEVNDTQTAAIILFLGLGRGTTSLNGGKAVLDIVHVNVDFPRVGDTVGSDHDPLLATFSLSK